jgi:K+ transporter
MNDTCFLLRFVHTRNVDLASNAISVETLPSFQIATAGDNDNMQCFLACVNTTLWKANLLPLQLFFMQIIIF